MRQQKTVRHSHHGAVSKKGKVGLVLSPIRRLSSVFKFVKLTADLAFLKERIARFWYCAEPGKRT